MNSPHPSSLFGPLDLAAPVIFALALIGVGWVRSRRVKAADDFLLVGRGLSAPAFVMSLVSAWYGGILGISEYSYSYGLSNWFVFGFPYYLWAAVFAIVLSKKARQSRLASIPDKLEEIYGPAAGRVGAAVVFFHVMPAAYLLMLGKLIAWVFGWNYPLALVVGTLFSTIYVYSGGLRSVTGTDTLQFVLMYVGFIIMLIVVGTHFGGLSFLQSHVPTELFSPLGGQHFQAVFVWYFIAATTLTEPLFFERSYAAKSEKMVLPGILTAIAFWAFFDFMTTTTGLYARALLPELADKSLAFPMLARAVLPAGLFGLFFIALLATVVSTIDSYSFLAAAALGRDLLWKGFSKDPARLTRYIRFGLLASSVVAFLVALASESVVHVWHAVGSIVAPTLLLPTLTAWYPRFRYPRRWVVPAMLISASVTLVWQMNQVFFGSYWFNLEPIYIGLTISFAFYLLGRLTRPQ